MRPLEGIKVIEFSTHVAVPNAARLLADWGAEVIKVENTTTGDLWRYYGLNCSTPITDDENPIFDVPNSNKQIVSLNVKTSEGMEVMMRLLSNADIIMTNVRLKSLIKLGMDYDHLSEKFPGLIYLHFTGYGYEGPLASNPGFDVAAFWSAGGMLAGWPLKGNLPFAPSNGFGDATVSSMVASGVLAGLVYKMRTGKGIHLTTSLYANALWYNFGDVISCQQQYNKERPAPAGNPTNPFLYFYECADGETIFLGGLDYDRVYVKSMTALGLTQYITDERYKTLEAYNQHRSEFYDILTKTFLCKPSAEWIRLFEEQDIVIQKMVRPQELASSEQAWANGYLTEVEYPKTGNKTVLPNSPVKFFGAEPSTTKAMGGIGRDTKDVLAVHGYSDEEIQTLLEAKVIRAPK
jgi:crotonobetainyl-CoA:carnitine CoA-transferase CaiB-like acyl-CoA transferase